MSDFWRQAQGSAAREFGARNHGLFVAIAVLRRSGPALSVLGILAVVAALAGSATVTRDAWVPWLPTILTLAAMAVGAIVLIVLAVWVWRNRWRWW